MEINTIISYKKGHFRKDINDDDDEDALPNKKVVKGPKKLAENVKGQQKLMMFFTK